MNYFLSLMTIVGIFLCLDAVAEPKMLDSTVIENLTASKAYPLLTADQEKAPIAIDVRTAKEFAAGHLKGAINIDMKSDDFEKTLAKLDREQTYLVHCKSGRRSSKVVPIFKKLGFKSLIHMTDGYDGWKEQK